MIRKTLNVLLTVAILVCSTLTFIGPLNKVDAATYHYWDKYSVVEKTEFSWELIASGNVGDIGGYNDYYLDLNRKQIALTGSWGGLSPQTPERHQNSVNKDTYSNSAYKYKFTGWSGSLPRYDTYYSRFSTVNVKGNLLQSNVKAVAGSFPDDGAHTDGYWYVRKSTNNNLPVLSLSSSGDLTLYNDGGTFSITGTVRDADNDSITVSAMIGGITKTATVTGTSAAKSWTLSWSGAELPIGSYNQINVEAADGKSVVTTLYNGKLTILAQVYYYWSKFNVTASGGWTLINDNTVSPGINLYKKSIGWEYLDDFAGRSSANYGRIRDLYSNSEGYVTGVDSTTGRLSLSNFWNPPAKYSNNSYETYSPIRMEMTTRQYGYYTDVTYNMYALTTNPPREKGSLIQSNIKSAQGTYPDDGIHSDGYWYVKAGVVPNNLPVLTVTQNGNRTINLKSGSDTFTISGTITDADNESIIVSAAIAGIKKEITVTNTGVAKAWALTWRTSEFNASAEVTGIQVTADDRRGGVAAANFSGKLTIDKTPLYYWDKYSTKQNTTYIEDASWTLDFYHQEATWDRYPAGAHKAYSFDSLTGKYIVSSYDSSSLRVGQDYYFVSGSKLYKFRITNAVGQWVWVDQYYKSSSSQQEIVKDALLQANLLDIDGTYPDNGIAPDGYWYVKKVTTNLSPVLAVNNSDIVLNKSSSSLILSGTVTDPDNDTVTIRSTINGVIKSVSITNTSVAANWQLSWSPTELAEGVYSGIEISAEDGKGGQDTIRYVGTITVDKTPPAVSFVSPNYKNDWSSDPITVTVNFSDNMVLSDSRFKITQTAAVPTSWDNTTNSVDLTIQEQGIWYVHAQAVDRANNETNSILGPIKIQNQPEVPKLKQLSVGEDWAEVSWNLPAEFPEGFEYIIENVTTGKSWNVLHPIDQIRDENLKAGTQYTYRIKAKNYVGESAWSDSLEILTRPAAPENLAITFVPNNSSLVNVSFDKVYSADSYTLTVKESGNLISEVELMDDGTHQIVNLEPGKQYTVIVTAKNSSGNGNSSVLGFLSLPAAPGEFKSVQIRETEVELGWLASNTASEYDLSRGNISVYKGSALTFTDKGLMSGTKYDYQLAAKNVSGFGDIAYLDNILTLPGKVNLSVETVGHNQVVLRWESVQGAERYVLSVNGHKMEELNASETRFKVSSLQPGLSYRFEVYAENDSGIGSADLVTVRTKPYQVDNLVVSSIGDSEASLSWMPANGADKYRISVNDAVYTEISGSEIKLAGLEAGTVYEVKVEAGNESGYGPEALESFLTLPAAPNHIQTEKVLSEAFTVSWDKVKSADKYILYNNNGDVIGESSSTSFTLIGLKPGMLYKCHISAVNETGEGSTSSFSQRTLPDTWSNDDNRNPVTIGETGENSVVIIVDPVEGADEYKIIDGDGNLIGVIKSPEIATEIDGLESAKEYSDWVIIPVNEAGEGKGTKIPSFVTLPSDKFEISVVPQQKSLTINIESDLKNETYVVMLNGKEVYRGKDKTINLTGLDSGKTYSIVVWTENSQGDKSEAKKISGTTLKEPKEDSTYGGGHSPSENKTKNEETELEIVDDPDAKEESDGRNKQPSVGSDIYFSDIDGLYNKDQIIELFNNGIVKGYDNKFYPDREMTRAEFMSLIVRALNLQHKESAEMRFEDISTDSWYYKSLKIAFANKMVVGYSETEFRPHEPITREQASKMLANALQTNYDGDKTFVDHPNIASWAEKEVRTLASMDIINGYPDGTFKPKNAVKRVESISLIYNSLNKK